MIAIASPYHRLFTKNPRRFIIVGSSNKPKLLLDNTGSRRFCIVRMLGDSKNDVRDSDALGAARLDIFGHCVDIIKQNKHLEYVEIDSEFLERNKKLNLDNIAETKLNDVIGRLIDEHGGHYFNLRDVGRYLDLSRFPAYLQTPESIELAFLAYNYKKSKITVYNYKIDRDVRKYEEPKRHFVWHPVDYDKKDNDKYVITYFEMCECLPRDEVDDKKKELAALARMG